MAKRFFLGINIFGAAWWRMAQVLIMGAFSNATAAKSRSNDRHGDARVLPNTNHTIAAFDRRLR